MVATAHNISNDTLEKIASEVIECPLCKLSRSRKNAVPGEGQISAKVIFIGEAPGKNEDEKGRPFVGVAGRILDEALQKAKLDYLNSNELEDRYKTPSYWAHLVLIGNQQPVVATVVHWYIPVSVMLLLTVFILLYIKRKRAQ